MHRNVCFFFALVVGCSAVAWADDTSALLPADRPLEQAIEHYVAALLKAENVAPAPHADDATLIRRLTLDLAGRIPTTAETAAYLADADPQKKVKLVDRLMASPGFVRHQATELNTLLQAEDAGRKGVKKTALREYRSEERRVGKECRL